MIDIVADTSSLKRSAMGSITGQVFLRGPAGDFPESGWSDFPVVVLGWWIPGLSALVFGEAHSFEGLFMDGPFAFVVERGNRSSYRMAWRQRGDETWIGIMDAAALLQSALEAGRRVAEECRAQAWSSTYLDELERVIANTERALR